MFEGKEMRQVLCQFLDEVMANDPKVVVIDADLAKANGTFNLRKKYPERAIDVGIAEQNMASIAAGMSSYGYKPFILSFTPFATRRICDQIAISICYAKQNVKIIGTDPGISAEFNGGTHMSVEDIGVLRSIPNLVIYEPVDAIQFYKSLPVILDYNGPVYIRMFRKVAEPVFDEDYEFNLFKADVVKTGTDVTVLASGIMVQDALKVSEKLKEEGINIEIINVHTIKPLDEETILNSLRKTNACVVLENHNLVGGLYSAVSELLSEKLPMRITKIGIPDRFGEVGKMPYLKEVMGMTQEDIINAIKKAISYK